MNKEIVEKKFNLINMLIENIEPRKIMLFVMIRMNLIIFS